MGAGALVVGGAATGAGRVGAAVVGSALGVAVTPALGLGLAATTEGLGLGVAPTVAVALVPVVPAGAAGSQAASDRTAARTTRAPLQRFFIAFGLLRCGTFIGNSWVVSVP